MANGTLLLTVTDVNGNPVGEPVDIFLQNQTLISDSPALRRRDVSSPLLLTGLNVFPNGRYRLELDSLSYHTVSRFLTIPPNGNGSVAVTLPVNPKKVTGVVFPDYAALPADAQALLERSKSVLNFAEHCGAELYGMLDNLRKAGFLNLVAKAGRTRFPTEQGEPRSVLSYIGELLELRQDRFLAKIEAGLRSETINHCDGKLFHKADEILHSAPKGYQKDKSFKTLDQYGNLQLSYFKEDKTGDYAVDMDIDDAQGFEHVFQVVGNFFGGPTHPYNIHEILIATQELDPGYRLLLA